MFSSRVPGQLEQNAFTRALSKARAGGGPLIDLTLTNPTRAGLGYPAAQLAGLGAAAAQVYDPEPFGLPGARDAVSRDYARRGLAIPADRVVLTASTSEAYSLLFKLLCEPSGDDVLVPVPSYPLFEHLTRLDGVVPRSYRLDYDGRWGVDLDTVDRAWTPRTRAVLAVSPNNPTGSVLTAREIQELRDRCRARGAALILDEVFADYPLDGTPPVANVAAEGGADVLMFRLGGLSKSAALPQVKLGWIALEGPAPVVREALERLELICDTYLSVSTPVQVAAPDLIAGGAQVREQVLQRVRGNHAALAQAASRHPAVDLLPADAGWSAVLRIPARDPEEAVVLRLIEADSVVVHPGFFFDFPHEAFLVFSLLPEPDAFREGVRRVLEHVDA